MKRLAEFYFNWALNAPPMPVRAPVASFVLPIGIEWLTASIQRKWD